MQAFCSRTSLSSKALNWLIAASQYIISLCNLQTISLRRSSFTEHELRLKRTHKITTLKHYFSLQCLHLVLRSESQKLGYAHAARAFSLSLAMKGESHFTSLQAAPHPLLPPPPRLFLLFDVTSTRLCLFCQWRRRAREKIQLVFRVKGNF